ncbi:MAG: CHRD domain-containing protein, partial [Chloroflexi bacterium]|nr:CHRD domain-containing protein [Chloroflexota bacterium]
APTPTPAPTPAATAAPTVYKATLLASSQNPPVTSAESACNGDVTITVTGAQVAFAVNVKGCPVGTAINIGHIHEGATGTNGPLRVDTTLRAGELTLTAGAATLNRTAPIDAAVASAIASNPAGFYFNLHSTMHAGGVIRGQLTRG